MVSVTIIFPSNINYLAEWLSTSASANSLGLVLFSLVTVQFSYNFKNKKLVYVSTVAIVIQHAEALLTLTAVHLRFLCGPREVVLPSVKPLLTLRHLKLQAKNNHKLLCSASSLVITQTPVLMVFVFPFLNERTISEMPINKVIRTIVKSCFATL